MLLASAETRTCAAKPPIANEHLPREYEQQRACPRQQMTRKWGRNKKHKVNESRNGVQANRLGEVSTVAALLTCAKLRWPRPMCTILGSLGSDTCQIVLESCREGL